MSPSHVSLVGQGTVSEILGDTALGKLATLFRRGMPRGVLQKSPPVAQPIPAGPRPRLLTQGAWGPKQYDKHMRSLRPPPQPRTCTQTSRNSRPVRTGVSSVHQAIFLGPAVTPTALLMHSGEGHLSQSLLWPSARKIHRAFVGVRSPKCLSSADFLALLRNF